MKSEKSYIIYRWRNKINGKCYIGLTSVPDKRKQQHIQGYCKSSWISQAIKKHGMVNFEYRELAVGLSQDEALDKERYFIKENNSFGGGYNQTHGGYYITAPRLGEDHHRAVMTDEVAQYIINDSCSEIEAARKYDIDRGAVYHLRAGNTWTHLDRGNAPKYEDSRKKITKEDAKRIFTDTRKNSAIANQYEIDTSLVSLIKNRRRWADATQNLTTPEPINNVVPDVIPFVIFRILNTSNDKAFIGVSVQPKKRISQLLSGHGSPAIAADIKKFGKSAFISHEIEYHDEPIEANRRTQTFIMRHNALHPFGYNKGIGGKGSSGHQWDLTQRAGITGSRNRRSKLTESQVAAIYFDARSRSATAKEYGVSTTMITKIKKGQAWKHVTRWLQTPVE